MKKAFHNILEGNILAECLFAYAFVWRNTKEGYNYWADVSHMWREYCHKNNIIKLKK